MDKKLIDAEKSIFFQKLCECLNKFGIIRVGDFSDTIHCYYDIYYIGCFTFYNDKTFGDILEINLIGKPIYQFYQNSYNWTRLNRDMNDIIKSCREKILENEKKEIRNERTGELQYGRCTR